MANVQSKIRAILGSERSRPVVLVPPVQDRDEHRELRSAETQLRELAASKSRLEARLAQSHMELASVAQLLHQSELVELQQKSDIDWLVSIGALLMNRPKWWFMLLPGIQRNLLHRRVRRRQLFDRDQYLARYPDVISSGQDPLAHYIRHGLGEGRVNDARS